MQLALDSDWDIYLDRTGNIAQLKPSEDGSLLCQRIKHRLQTFRGECYLDRSVGVPYFSEVMKKNPDLRRIRALLTSVVAGVEGVAKVLELGVVFDPKTRHMTATFRAQADDGTIATGEV